MKTVLIALISTVFVVSAVAQRVNPVIKNYGGVFEAPFAEETIDPNLTYNIIIEVERASEKPDTLNWALNNVARLINLHAMAGVKREKLNVVLAIHGGAAYTAMSNEAYKTKYGKDNPNIGLYKELSDAGVKMFICAQSLTARSIDRLKLVPGVKIATSMLTTMTTYQLKGYAVVKF